MRFSAFLCLVFAVIAGFVGLLAREPSATIGREVFGILLLMAITIFAGSLFQRDSYAGAEEPRI